MEDEKIEITLASDVGKALQESGHSFDPVDDDFLDSVERVAYKGLGMHQMLGIGPDDEALPIHFHPLHILAMIQEIRQHRQQEK